MSDSLKQDFNPLSIKGYHAHVYYRNESDRQHAATIRDAVPALFEVVMGRWRDEPVGPHPLPMYQMAFEVPLFQDFVPWLQSVRGPLSILVHTSTGVSDRMDHSVGAMWLGSSLNLDLEFFDRNGKSA
ncbi:MAG: aromatic ring-cleaving dioxygenase [Gammaproteobacteria bacterium]|jgi:aromatic ring-cleaving dioxygenase